MRAAIVRSVVWACAGALAGCASGASPAEVDRIVELLELEPGMTVADVGAGEGDFAVELARRVGGEGRVIATEVEEDLVDDLRQLAADEGLDNLHPILGDQETSGLAAGCCDAVLLRMVYHHFEQPGPMRASLRAALRPGGRIAVIDIVPQSGWRELPGVPDRGGHGIPPEQLLEEMSADGFVMVSRVDDWNDDDERFCLVFRRPEPAPPGEP